jgi:flagellar hook assembly protein FlgD
MIDIPAQYALSQNFPNPFTASTSLRFDLPELSRVTLTIYDVSGREVERLVDGVIDPGRHVATWSGRNRAGRPAEAGLYFVRMIATSQTGTGGLRTDRRVALVR